jgi:hypothetical protein
MAPEARKYGEVKQVWECPKKVQRTRNLDLMKVTGCAAALYGR